MRLRSVKTGRVLGFDLESKPLAFWGDWGPTAEITAFCWKWRDEPHAHTMLLSADGTWDLDGEQSVSDQAAYRSFANTLETADVVYGHNIRGFDLPLLNAGLLRRELSPLKSMLTTDTLKDLPKRKDMSASLENLAAMYQLDEEGKKHMSVMDWERANKLTPGGVLKARERVVSDVLLQERLRDRLLELGLLKAPRVWAA